MSDRAGAGAGGARGRQRRGVFAGTVVHFRATRQSKQEQRAGRQECAHARQHSRDKAHSRGRSRERDGGAPPSRGKRVRMRTLRYVLCDVFTSRPLEGNQLAVFTDARGVPDGLMQRLALEMGFSESTFVLPPSGAGHARVRIFTPRVELAFAGHPVLGTALVIGGAIEAREVRLELTESI